MKYARTAGACRVGGDVEADKFVSEGSFRITGLISADEIDIRLGGEVSRAGDRRRADLRSPRGGRLVR
ncbi:hypothetical protein M1O56_05240 [Dehalococcoidia bacterium]|nr:hypothetical protein [Dehalococcoidia bacterium]MCL0079051.1 hypothetical protein [Dehalococcoidia bacterium]